MKNTVPLNLLPDILAQIIHFAWEDFAPSDELPEEVAWCIAHVCACFLAQNTHYGYEEGVEGESTYVELQIGHRMPYEKRLELARNLAEAWEKES